MKIETVIINFRKSVLEIPNTTYATFGLYRYPAKFIPQVIAYALKNYAHQGSSVIDPFAGYGTVGIISRLFGYDYELWDLNPLLKYLHDIAIMEPLDIDINNIIKKMLSNKNEFYPDWPNIEYWYPKEFLPMLFKVWGFYHSIQDQKIKNLLLIPLIKASRYYSYNDEKRLKLSRSPISKKRVDLLLKINWKENFFLIIREGIKEIIKKQKEYHQLNPKKVLAIIKAGVDVSDLKIENTHTILITSPPYLQAQEYIRSAKIDLYWLGYANEKIKELSNKEIPYKDVTPIEIFSDTYYLYKNKIYEPHLKKLFERYFHGVLGILSRLQENITDYLLIFLGSANIRTNSIPIDKIFIEHFLHIGWQHQVTLIDNIKARSMFFYKTNPATGLNDNRMTKEHLVVLRRRQQ